MGKTIPIKTFQNKMEADLAKGFLEQNGIKAMVSTDSYAGADIRPPMLLVNEEDKETALRLLEDETGSPSIDSG